MRKILSHAKTITPKKFWKAGFAVISLDTALKVKRLPFKFIDADREGFLKTIFQKALERGSNYVVIYRKAKLTKNRWRHSYGILSELSMLSPNGFDHLDKEERTSRIVHSIRHSYLNIFNQHKEEWENSKIMKFLNRRVLLKSMNSKPEMKDEEVFEIFFEKNRLHTSQEYKEDGTFLLGKKFIKIYVPGHSPVVAKINACVHGMAEYHLYLDMKKKNKKWFEENPQPTIEFLKGERIPFVIKEGKKPAHISEAAYAA